MPGTWGIFGNENGAERLFHNGCIKITCGSCAGFSSKMQIDIGEKPGKWHRLFTLHDRENFTAFYGKKSAAKTDYFFP